MKLDLTLDEFHTIAEAGLHLDDIYVLRMIEEGVNWESHMLACVVRMSLGRLSVKHYLGGGKLTDKAQLLLGKLRLQVDVVAKKPDSLSSFAMELHAELVDRMIRLTGRKQKMIQDKYAFLCNKTDLETKLRAVIKKYGEIPLPKVRMCLLKHIEKSFKSGWDRVYLMEYFIMKEGVSRMMTALENDEPDEKQGGDTIPLTDPKSLF